MTPQTHIMLDIETLGTSPGCAILRLTAVEFDIETGKTGDVFDSGISLESNLSAGLRIEASTLKWWMEQKDEVRKLAFGSGEELIIVLDGFERFIYNFGSDVCVWGNGIRFDAGILEGAYKSLGLELPFNGRQDRDVRTLVSFRPDIKRDMKFEGRPHVALDDCMHQIRYCSAIWSELNGKNAK